MKKMRSLCLIYILATMLILLAACSSGNGPGYDVDANLLIGWDYVEDADYQNAVDKFHEVLENDDDNAVALTGLGWSFAFDMQLDSAEKYFTGALAYDQNSDIHMGLAAVYRDKPNYAQAVSYASQVISDDPDYVFTYRISINYQDAYLIRAQSYFAQGSGQFANAAMDVNYLCDQNGIAQLPDPASISAAEYEQALAEKLDQLSELIS